MKNRKERREEAAAARHAGSDPLAQADDVMLTDRQRRMAELQTKVLDAIEQSGAIDKENQTTDIGLIIESLTATMVPFAIMGGYDEEEFTRAMRALYIQIKSHLAPEPPQTRSRLLLPTS